MLHCFWFEVLKLLWLAALVLDLLEFFILFFEREMFFEVD